MSLDGWMEWTMDRIAQTFTDAWASVGPLLSSLSWSSKYHLNHQHPTRHTHTHAYGRMAPPLYLCVSESASHP